VVSGFVTPAFTPAVLSEIPQPSSVRSEAGATLWLTLPQGPQPSTEPGDLMPNPVTILLVEDNPDDESLTVRALRMGTTANIELARDGQEALDYLFNDAKSMPRLVLLDLNLPELDGLKVLQRIREDERTCLSTVVILTGFAAPIDVIAAYRYGANSYVRKPVDFDQFAEVIHQLGLYWLVVNEPPPNARDQ
jgi:two-component system, response regulator